MGYCRLLTNTEVNHRKGKIMEEQKIYKLTDEEYKLFEHTTKTISCPNLASHDCSLCPMNININYDRASKADYRCLTSLMEHQLLLMKNVIKR